MSVPPGNRGLLAARVRVPAHVALRRFPSESVALNLETGHYHGLNDDATDMVEAMVAAASVADAADGLATVRGLPPEAIEQQLCELCTALEGRGLIQVDRPGE